MSISRRTLCKWTAAAGLLGNPLAWALEKAADGAFWQSALGKNLADGKNYQAQVEGQLPADLQGTLYRNGPGLFERDGYSKKSLLDGDGLIQSVRFDAGKVQYQNHFVRTPKYLEEEAAGKFTMPTWTTLAPDFWNNIPGTPQQSQAGVTTYLVNGQLTAHDEGGNPFLLDPVTLEDRGELPLKEQFDVGGLKAHTKFDQPRGDWIFLSWNHGPTASMDVLIRDAQGQAKLHRTVEAPRDCYVHDFFASENYVIANMHAVTLNPFPMLAGMRSLTDSLSWEPDLGNTIVVIPKDQSKPVQWFDAPPRWMWHSFNAYEKGDEIIADFVGYDEPDHFIGEDPTLSAVMEGRLGQAQHSGQARRYVINLNSGQLREELLADGNYEFPIIHPALNGYEYNTGYASFGGPGQFLHSGLARFDMNRGQVDSFDFGDTVHVGEPIFAPRGEAQDQGYLLSMALDGETGKSFVAVTDAGHLSDGPVARIHLEHHTPLSFHGFWAQA